MDGAGMVNTWTEIYGNALAKPGRFPAAVARDWKALERRTTWPEAKINLVLVPRLFPKERTKSPEEAPRG